MSLGTDRASAHASAVAYLVAGIVRLGRGEVVEGAKMMAAAELFLSRGLLAGGLVA